jgi:hypothetical protein
VAARAEPPRAEPRYERPQNRDFRRRDEDLGPPVQGFGDDIPAFMMLPRRAVREPVDVAEDAES